VIGEEGTLYKQKLQVKKAAPLIWVANLIHYQDKIK
jgi:hypothetical protein